MNHGTILRIWQEAHGHLNIPLQSPNIMIIIRIYNDALQAEVFSVVVHITAWVYWAAARQFAIV